MNTQQIKDGQPYIEAVAGMLFPRGSDKGGFVASIKSNNADWNSKWHKDLHIMTKEGIEMYIEVLAAGFASIVQMSILQGYHTEDELKEKLEKCIGQFTVIAEGGEGKLLVIPRKPAPPSNN